MNLRERFIEWLRLPNPARHVLYAFGVGAALLIIFGHDAGCDTFAHSVGVNLSGDEFYDQEQLDSVQ